jgi:filamentous hemagglutinin family protein
MSPRVSLITTVYNRVRYLGCAIESVLAQSFADFELIIWDDGSTDGSLEVAQGYAQKDQRVRVVVADHQGRVQSLFDAHTLARGEYLAWVDSDDVLAPTALEESVAVLDADKAIGMVYSNYDVIDEQGENKGLGKRCQIPFSKKRLLLDFMTFHFRVMRRSVFELAGGIDVTVPCAVDYDLCLRLSEVTEISHLARSLYFYRVHEASISQSQRLAQVEWAKESIARALVRRGMDKEWEVSLEVHSTLAGEIEGRYQIVRKEIDKPRSVLKPWVRWVSRAMIGVNFSLFTLNHAAWAQSITPNVDGMGTQVTVNGTQYDISGGTLSSNGQNLFHSFKDFNLSSEQIANFLSNPQILNILARVNGGDPSVIDGLLKVSGGNSNLFLMNPSGIVFGNNASLDVQGAFAATTANGIQFADSWFGATGSNDYGSLLGSPTGFGFSMSQPGALFNAGNLSVKSDQSLSLVGGTVINTGNLSGGQVTLSAVPGESYVRLSQPGQALSLDIPDRPNAWNGTIASLPQLLTGGNAASATGVTVNPDGTVQLTGTELTVNGGDVANKGDITAQTATLSATNNLSLAASQLKTAQDLTLKAQNQVIVRDSVEKPFLAQAGGNLTVRGDRGIDIFALKHPGTYAFQSGGNLSFLSDGIISGDAHFKSGGNLSFRNLTGGAGKFVSLFDPVIYSDGDVDLGYYTGTSLKVEAGGNILAQDITITGPDDSGSIPEDDPDYYTLTGTSALILRGGLSEPASIISVGNIRAQGGHVELLTNGNIFTGNIDVSSNEGGERGGSIQLKAYNIFTGSLNASSTSGHEVDFEPGDYAGYGNDVSNMDSGGSISIEAGYLLRTGNLNASSQSGDGGSITVTAADMEIGSQSVSAGPDRVLNAYWGSAGAYPSTYTFEEGTVSINKTPAPPAIDPMAPTDPGNSTDPIAPDNPNPNSDPSSGLSITSSTSTTGSSGGSSGASMGGGTGSSGTGQTIVISVPSGNGNTSDDPGSTPDIIDDPTVPDNASDPIDSIAPDHSTDSIAPDHSTDPIAPDNPTANSDPSTGGNSSNSTTSGGAGSSGSGQTIVVSVPSGSPDSPVGVSNAGTTIGGSGTSINPAAIPPNLFISDSNSSRSNQQNMGDDDSEDSDSEEDSSPEATRHRILTFLEAQRLAGERWTAKAISEKLDIPIEIARIAVINPIGRDVKVEIPDISGLYGGTLVAGDDTWPLGVCDDIVCKVTIGTVTLVFTKLDEFGGSVVTAISNTGNAIWSKRGAAAEAIHDFFFPIDGDNLRGNTEQLAIHLARLLQLSEVGGQPPGEEPPPDKDPENHWWREIKTFVKNILKATKKAKRPQVLRELMKNIRKGRYTEEQILDIERRLAEAEAKMGEKLPEVFPLK